MRSLVVVGDQSLSSLTNFATTLVAARLIGPHGFGTLALAMTVGFVIMSLARGLTAEPLLTVRPAERTVPGARLEADALRLSVLLGAACGALMVAVSLLSPPLLVDLRWVGLCIPALLLQDAMRYVAFARGAPSAALVSDVAWLIVQFSCLSVLVLTDNPAESWVALSWGMGAVAGALVGGAALRVWPSGAATPWLAQTSSYSSWVLPQLALNQATYLMGTVIVAASFGAAALGGMRAMQTFVMPVFILMTALQALLVPSLVARLVAGGTGALMRTTPLLGARITLIAAAAAGVAILAGRPASHLLFGAEFTGYDELVTPFAVGAIGHAAYAVPSAAMRAQRRGRELLFVQVVASAFTLGLAGFAAAVSSLVAAVWAINAQGFVASVAGWWILTRHVRPGTAASMPAAPHITGAGGRDRRELWLDLLRRLSAAEPTWLVWKNVDSALLRLGDVDSAAKPESWPTLTAEFTTWVGRHDLWPMAVCRHVPGGVNLFAMPAGEATIYELSIKNSKAWRGSSLFQLADLLPLAEDDERGFRRLRPGAEGALKLVLNVLTWRARPNLDALRDKEVAPLIRQDPEGVRQAAGLFGDAAGSLVTLADAAARGDWDLHAARVLQRAALRKAARNPRSVARRLRFRMRSAHRCPLMAATLRAGRRVPTDRDQWLELVRQTHPAYVNGDPPQHASMEVR